ncbi:DUF7793 family protein [Arthrobacter citreus]
MAVKQEIVSGAAEGPVDGSEISIDKRVQVTDCTGYVRVTLPPGRVITGPMAAAAAAEFNPLAQTGPRPLLLDVTGVEAITRGARSVFAAARSVSSVAVLGTSQVDRVIANFLLGGDLPACPARYFSSAAQALDWLKGRA